MAESITPGTIAVTAGSGVLLDSVSLTVNSNAVESETVVIRDPGNASQYAEVTAKGTQADYGLGVQDLKDSGRTQFHFSIPAQTASSSSTPVAITNITQTSGFAATSGVTSFSIPSGKTLRIVQFSVCGAAETVTTVSTSKTALVVQIRVGSASTSTAIAAGVIVAQVDLPIATGSAAGIDAVSESHSYPDGIDIPNGNAEGNFVGVTFANGTANAITMQLLAGSIVGFTY